MIGTTILKITSKLIDDSKGKGGKLSKAEKLRDNANKKRILAKKREIQSLMNKANKRLKRLERANLKSSPAYKGLYREGGWTESESRFGVRGKTAKEIDREYLRIKKFLADKTSTVRGAILILKQTAKNVGLKYKTVGELKEISPKFFELASKAKQYLESSNRQAEALDYNRIFVAINQLTRKGKIDFQDTKDATEKVNVLINEINSMMGK